jgi:hypothetical protein
MHYADSNTNGGHLQIVAPTITHDTRTTVAGPNYTIGEIAVSPLSHGVDPAFGGGTTQIQMVIPALEAQIERLLGLLRLTDEERSFVQAALAADQGKDFFLVLADYLTDKGNEAAAAKFRALGGR